MIPIWNWQTSSVGILALVGTGWHLGAPPVPLLLGLRPLGASFSPAMGPRKDCNEAHPRWAPPSCCPTRQLGPKPPICANFLLSSGSESRQTVPLDGLWRARRWRNGPSSGPLGPRQWSCFCCPLKRARATSGRGGFSLPSKGTCQALVVYHFPCSGCFAPRL